MDAHIYHAQFKMFTGYIYTCKLHHSIVFLAELQPPYDYSRGYKPVPQYPPEQHGYAPAPPVFSQQSNSVRPHLHSTFSLGMLSKKKFQWLNHLYHLLWQTGNPIPEQSTISATKKQHHVVLMWLTQRSDFPFRALLFICPVITCEVDVARLCKLILKLPETLANNTSIYIQVAYRSISSIIQCFHFSGHTLHWDFSISTSQED